MYVKKGVVFDFKRLIAACVPSLYAYFATSSSTPEGMLLLYEEPFFSFSLFLSAFTAVSNIS